MSGIISGGVATPSDPASLVIHVSAGSALFGTTTHAITGGTVTLDAADATNPRFDLISAHSDGTLAVAKGTPAASPVAAAPASGDLPLAIVFVPANATALGDHNIADRRVSAGGNVQSVAGKVGVVTLVPLDAGITTQAHPTDLTDNSGGTAAGTIAVIRTDTAAHVAADAANAVASLAAFAKSINDKLVSAGIFT